MRVLLTGAAGFIGTALARRLDAQGHELLCLIRDGNVEVDSCEVVYGDLRDMPTVERAMAYCEPDAVFHLAAQAYVPVAKRDPWGTLEDNVRGTYNLLEAFRRHAFPESTLVAASSDKAYGELGDGAAEYRESDPMAGRGPYDCSKSCADLLAQSYALEYGLRIAVVRAGNVYGPGDTHRTRLMPSIVADVLAGADVRIRSDGSPVRDYLYIDDAVEGYAAVERYLRSLTHDSLLHMLPEAPHRAFNLSGDEPRSVRRVVDEVIQATFELGLAVNGEVVTLGTRRGEISYQSLDTSLARRVLGWKPRVDLREGVMRTVRAAAVEAHRIGP